MHPEDIEDSGSYTFEEWEESENENDQLVLQYKDFLCEALEDELYDYRNMPNYLEWARQMFNESVVGMFDDEEEEEDELLD